MPKVTPEDIAARLQEEGITDEATVVENATVEKVKEKPEVEEEITQPEEQEESNDDVDSDAAEGDIEEQARAQGWKPDGPKSAEQFVKDGEYIEEIKSRGKEIKSLKKQMDEMMRHISGLKKAGYQEKMDIIESEREDAIARSDVDSVKYLDQELERVKRDLSNEDRVNNVAHPAALEFAEKYKHVANDMSLRGKELREFIHQRDNELGSLGLDPEEHIRILEDDMKYKFPDRFKSEEPKSKPRASAVESDSRPVTKGKKTKYSFADLSYEQKQVCKNLEYKGVMTKEEYIKQLVEIGDVK